MQKLLKQLRIIQFCMVLQKTSPATPKNSHVAWTSAVGLSHAITIIGQFYKVLPKTGPE